MTPSSACSSTVASPADERSAPSSASALEGVTSALRICPPSRPISMRTNSSATRNHLRENAVDGIGMDERELDPEEPHPRSRVDQVRTFGVESVERREEIVGLEGDVMHAGTAPCEEATDRCVVLGRGQELDPTLADEKRRGLDPLTDDRLALLEARAEE